MKINKISILALAAVIAAALCGCNGGNLDTSEPDSGSSTTTDSGNGGSSSNSQTVAPESSSETNDNDSAPSQPRERTVLIGALNDEIDKNDIIRAAKSFYNEETQSWDDIEIAVDRIDEDKATDATAGFAYCALPLYPSLTNRESEYDEVNSVFKDVPTQKKSDFIKVRPGDDIFGFTVSEAGTDFYIGDNGGRTEMGTSHIKLEGSAEMEGYIRILTEPEYATGMGGDIIFVPSGNVQLPVVHFNGRDENSTAYRVVGSAYMMQDLVYTNEFSGFFELGNVNETTVDLSDIPDDGSFVKVKVTLSDFEMSSTIEWFSNSSAVLESITRID